MNVESLPRRVRQSPTFLQARIKGFHSSRSTITRTEFCGDIIIFAKETIVKCHTFDARNGRPCMQAAAHLLVQISVAISAHNVPVLVYTRQMP